MKKAQRGKEEMETTIIRKVAKEKEREEGRQKII
jgi:hypothetical protein